MAAGSFTVHTCTCLPARWATSTNRLPTTAAARTAPALVGVRRSSGGRPSPRRSQGGDNLRGAGRG